VSILNVRGDELVLSLAAGAGECRRSQLAGSGFPGGPW